MRFNVTIAGESFTPECSTTGGAAAYAALMYEGQHGPQPDGLVAEIATPEGVIKKFVRRNGVNIFDVTEAP